MTFYCAHSKSQSLTMISKRLNDQAPAYPSNSSNDLHLSWSAPNLFCHVVWNFLHLCLAGSHTMLPLTTLPFHIAATSNSLGININVASSKRLPLTTF